MTAGAPASDRPRLVLVVGAARSGTSAMAGLFDGLGVHVPGPYLKANPSNPKGFYEARRAVLFHNKLLSKAGVRINDNRLDAPTRVVAACGPRRQERLAGWLADVTAGEPQTVVKDPRATYALEVWAGAADGLGLDLGLVLMLRHPAEVVASRQTYYADTTGTRSHASPTTASLAGWVAGTLIAERDSRARPRVIVRYPDVLADWRREVRRVGDALGLRFRPEPQEGVAHQLDGFIEPELNRHRPSWDRLDAPTDLVALADAVWECCSRVARDGEGTSSATEFDELTRRYLSLQRQAATLAQGVPTR